MFKFFKSKPVEVKIAGLEAELEALIEFINVSTNFPQSYADRRLELARIIAELKYKAATK